MVVFTEGRHAAEFLLSEDNGNRSRENAMIANSVDVIAGAVLIRTATTNAPAVGTPVFAGTGNGAMTLASPAYGVGARQGTYRVQLIDEAANLGDFEVIRPDGTIDGIATVGVAYVGQIKFTIADGATDFTSPAVFAVPVTIAGSTFAGTFTPLLAGVTVNEADTVALALYPKTAAETDRGMAVIARAATVNGNCLGWPASQAASDKDAAVNALTRAGIIVR